jgi:prevent-host-death family protein
MQIDLTDGIIPISAAASQLARRLKQAQESRKPVVITQKGYPTAVLLSIESYLQLLELAGLGELARRDAVLAEANRGYAAIAADPAAAADRAAERRAWETTVADGLPRES